MAAIATATSYLSTSSFSNYQSSTFRFSSLSYPINYSTFSLNAQFHPSRTSFNIFSTLSNHLGGGNIGGGGNRGGERGGGGEDDDNAGERNKKEAIVALAEAERTLDSLPKDLASAIEAGKIPPAIVYRFLELEKSPVLRWLLSFGGFRERLLADDLFLTKVAIECGIGIFTKSAAELEKRRENFRKELDFVFADVVMAIVADFMLVWLPAPTVILRPSLATGSGSLAKLFYNCPDNAFQVVLSGTSYSFLQRIGAIVRNGAKLFAVGSGASLEYLHHKLLESRFLYIHYSRKCQYLTGQKLLFIDKGCLSPIVRTIIEILFLFFFNLLFKCLMSFD